MVLREQLGYPIGRQQCLIYMARLGYRLVKPEKQNLITFSARIKRMKVSNLFPASIACSKCSIFVRKSPNLASHKFLIVAS